MINPTDPVSQEEWAKQLAVKRVHDKWGFNADQEPDENAPRDTIIVHATFDDTNGFFGLTPYLNYAEDQLKRCFEWTQLSRRHSPVKHEFPWRHIDQTQINATGFVPISFRFTIDERKILDLLTGHTLYNDTDVVLRELVQNSLDAVRLQFWEQKTGADFPGRVWIHWDSAMRVLTVRDNGTGMSQQIIEGHLLRVGSSRYQDTRFKEQHPDFTPISRFGIGVLSTFMIADEVEIVTSHPDDDEARQLTLRSVHGKYLIRLLDKSLDPEAKRLGAHGTIVRLKLRPTAKVEDIIATSRKWIVVPGAAVEAQVDDHDPILVGYTGTRQALRAHLQARGYEFADDYTGKKGSETVAIMGYAEDGVEGAFAVQWSPFFREWSFMRDIRESPRDAETASKPDSIGTCIEGIRVLHESPGYDGRGRVARLVEIG